MEKINVELKSKPEESFVFEGQMILVKPYVDIVGKNILIENYINSLSNTEDEIRGYIEAEYGMILGLLDLCTNVDIKGLEIDKIIDSGLWEQVRSKIVNYDELQKDIVNVKKVISENKSTSKMLSGLISKVSVFIDGLSKMDLSEEGIKSLVSQLQSESKVLDNIIPVIGGKKTITSKKTPKTPKKIA
jgi:hypothetical protein